VNLRYGRVRPSPDGRLDKGRLGSLAISAARFRYLAVRQHAMTHLGLKRLVLAVATSLSVTSAPRPDGIKPVSPALPLWRQVIAMIIVNTSKS
jgi:hypothetical protein